MLSRSKYTIYHIDKKRTWKKTQIESINNRKQTIKKRMYGWESGRGSGEWKGGVRGGSGRGSRSGKGE